MDKQEALPRKTHNEYTVGWVCALPKEQTAATAMLDQLHSDLPKPPNDTNAYTLGSIGGHNVVIACLPKGIYGVTSAAVVAVQMIGTFTSIKFGLMVGIGGGVPPQVRLGDVVVSTPVLQFPGVVQWDMGKAKQDGFERCGALNNPPAILLTALSKLETRYELVGTKIPDYLNEMEQKWPRLAEKYLRSDSLKDVLFRADYNHVNKNPDDDPSDEADEDEQEEEENQGSCQFCDVTKTVQRKPRDMRVHFGLIASGNQVIKDSSLRTKLKKELGGSVLCIEMEAAGLMNSFPCLVIRGICDYADSHKNKDWQEHAAAVAAAFAKEFVNTVTPEDVKGEPRAKDILSQVEQIKLNLEAVQEQVHTGFLRTKDTLQDIIDEKLRLATLEWLTPIDYAPQQNDYISRRQLGTGEWLLESAEFQTWLNERKQTFFCPGIPGAGKTIQTSILIHGLFNRFRNDASTGIAYLYCNFRRQAEQTAEYMLINLLKQLAAYHDPLPSSVQELYKRHSTRRTRPVLNEISTTLQAVVATTYSRVFLIIDALDECQDTDSIRGALLAELFNLQNKTGLNLFVTSRFIPDIMKRFKGCLTLDIRPSHDDVWKYLDSHMSQLPDFVTDNKDLQIEVKTEIEAAMEGIFLLAQLYLDSLIGKRSPAALRKALKDLRKASKKSHDGSSALYDAYEKAMERIQRQRGDLPRDAMLILSWIVNAKRQLKVSELQHALAVEAGKSSLDKDNIPNVNHIIQACAPLLTVDEESEVIRLVHYTTQEYFERTFEEWYPEGKTEIARICVTYLCFDDLDTGFCHTDQEYHLRLRESVFFNYAAHNWGHHVREAPSPVHELLNFMESAKKVEAAGQGLMSEGNSYDSRSYDTTNIMTALHLAAFFGLTDITSILLEKGYDPNIQDTYEQTPIWWAARNGHEAEVRLLLQTDAIVDSVDYASRQTPLSWAARNGHESVVRLLLLGKKADINSKDFSGTTPLSWAARNGHEAAVKVFLQQEDIDIESKNKWGLTALCWAARYGHDSVVKLLLDGKADFNAVDINGTSVLQWTAWEAQDTVLRLLLDKGSCTEIRNKAGGTALAAAIEKQSDAMVKLLLDHGAKVGYSYSIFQCRKIAKSTHEVTNQEEYVVLYGFKWGNPGWFENRDRYFEAEGVNFDDDEELTEWLPIREVSPLWHAGEKSNAVIVKLLQASGCRLEFKKTDKDDGKEWRFMNAAFGQLKVGSPPPHRDGKTKFKTDDVQAKLLWAAGKGHDMLVRLLLENDENAADSQDDKGRTSLCWAAANGHLTMVELLLSCKEVNYNHRDDSGMTPLLHAAKKGHEDIVELLLTYGKNHLNTDKTSISGQTLPPQAATKGNDAAMGEPVASGRVNVDLKDNSGRTALSHAAGKGDVGVVRLLLENGASEALDDETGQTPLSYAVKACTRLKKRHGWVGLQKDEYQEILKLLGSSDDSPEPSEGDVSEYSSVYSFEMAE